MRLAYTLLIARRQGSQDGSPGDGSGAESVALGEDPPVVVADAHRRDVDDVAPPPDGSRRDQRSIPA
jgi:hypothetical protein